MANERVVRRLGVLQDEAGREPVPQRKFFHIGLPEVDDEVGECIPMIAWVDDNLSRYVVSDAPSASWGRGASAPMIVALPNHAVQKGEGIFLVTGPGEDSKMPHPEGKGSMHFIHLHQARPLWAGGVKRIYVYRLEGVQLKGLVEKKG